METHLPSISDPWPALDYPSWDKTLKTLHMFTQIVGKIRLKVMPWQNHSWHASLYISARGLTTGPMPYADGMFEIEFDFTSHELNLHTSFKPTVKLPLPDQSVADFYTRLMGSLTSIGVHVNIHSKPNEVDPSIPFAENTSDRTYDRQAVENFWQVAIKTYGVFSKFRSDFLGKCSPVHFFWGAFDIAVTRFSGKSAPLHQGEMPNMPKSVMQEAYSQEVSSCGFWPGSDAFPQAMFYAYAYPSPSEYGMAVIQPDEAFWSPEMGEFFLPYDAVRTSKDPEGKLLSFLQSTYAAAADLGDWNRDFLER